MDSPESYYTWCSSKVSGCSSWLLSICMNSRKHNLGTARYVMSSDSGHKFSPIGLSVDPYKAEKKGTPKKYKSKVARELTMFLSPFTEMTLLLLLGPVLQIHGIMSLTYSERGSIFKMLSPHLTRLIQRHGLIET